MNNSCQSDYLFHEIMFLSFQLTSCIFISVSIPPPHNVKLKVVADGSILVTWEPSKESRLTGYEVF